MDYNDQLFRYFGTADLSAISPAALESGIERIAVDFGLAQDRRERFALWVLLYMLGAAPDLEVAFKEATDRDAARDFMDMIDREAGGG